jgi:PhnB protein
MPSKTEEAAIRAVIEDWASALRSKDAARLLSHGVPGMVHFSLAPPLVDHDAGGNALQTWFDTWQGPVGYQFRDLTITAGDDVAFCHCLNRMIGMRTTGEKTDVWFRHTLGFRKIDGRWKIAHAHESVPFYMDGSYKAAADLKPR